MLCKVRSIIGCHPSKPGNGLRVEKNKKTDGISSSRWSIKTKNKTKQASCKGGRNNGTISCVIAGNTVPDEDPSRLANRRNGETTICCLKTKKKQKTKVETSSKALALTETVKKKTKKKTNRTAASGGSSGTRRPRDEDERKRLRPLAARCIETRGRTHGHTHGHTHTRLFSFVSAQDRNS